MELKPKDNFPLAKIKTFGMGYLLYASGQPGLHQIQRHLAFPFIPQGETSDRMWDDVVFNNDDSQCYAVEQTYTTTETFGEHSYTLIFEGENTHSEASQPSAVQVLAFGGSL